MAKYHKSALTAAGLALANRAAKGQATFKITRATSTAETIEDTAIAGLVKLPNEVQVGTIMGDQPLSDGDGTITGTKVLFTNHNLQTSYQVRAIGLYAVESDGDEFLYAVVTAIEPEFMPDFSDQVLMEFGMTIYVVVGQVDNMSIIVNPDSLATVAYVDKAIADHQVVFPETLTYSNHNEVITSKWMFKGGVVDSEGTQLATVKDVSTGDTANLEAAKAYADTQLSLVDKSSFVGKSLSTNDDVYLLSPGIYSFFSDMPKNGPSVFDGDGHNWGYFKMTWAQGGPKFLEFFDVFDHHLVTSYSGNPATWRPWEISNAAKFKPFLVGVQHEGADLNNETTPGSYFSNSKNTNGPSIGGFSDHMYLGWTVALMGDSNVIHQTAFKVTGDLAERTFYAGSGWGPWKGMVQDNGNGTITVNGQTYTPAN
uniref:pyocin knob domain-containing protein n=1 Tax=Levilactobacillus namurensis TaxID=380393 RepID=UPI0026F2C1B9